MFNNLVQVEDRLSRMHTLFYFLNQVENTFFCIEHLCLSLSSKYDSLSLSPILQVRNENKSNDMLDFACLSPRDSEFWVLKMYH